MTTKTEKKAEPPKQIEKNTQQYSCQIILEKTTLNKAEDRNLPTCLLYTSPSPRDRQKSRMPSSA